MNIDLFHNGQSEAGLVCDTAFKEAVTGIILDAQTRELTLELTGGGTFHLNVPVEESHKDKLLFSHRMHIGFIEGGLLTDALEVPLLYLNDPYGSSFGQDSPLAKPQQSIVGFDQFMKRCRFAQAVHRDDLGNEDDARSVLKGVDPYALEYSPALQRQIRLGRTSTPQAAPSAQATPNPNLGGPTVQMQPKPPTKMSDGDGNK